MLLDTRIYSLRVGISTVFEIFGHFLNRGRQEYSIWLLTSHHHLLLDTRNKNIISIYGLGVGNSTVSKIFGHFLFKGGWNHPVWS
jgi:hypothetical protein